MKTATKALAPNLADLRKVMIQVFGRMEQENGICLDCQVPFVDGRCPKCCKTIGTIRCR